MAKILSNGSGLFAVYLLFCLILFWRAGVDRGWGIGLLFSFLVAWLWRKSWLTVVKL